MRGKAWEAAVREKAGKKSSDHQRHRPATRRGGCRGGGGAGGAGAMAAGGPNRVGRRLFHPRREGRREIQGVHPPAHLHQAPVRCLRRRAEPHRPRGRLARQGLQAGEARQEARALLPAAGTKEPGRRRVVGHPHARGQDRREPHHPPARHRRRQPAAQGHHRPRGLQRHHPRPARHRRRPPLQPHRGHQRQAPRPQRRGAGHHRPQLRIPHPQVRGRLGPERGRVLHARRGRPRHGAHHGHRAGHGRATTPPAAPPACSSSASWCCRRR